MVEHASRPVILSPILEEAFALHSEGFRPVAIHPNSKRPVGNDWQTVVRNEHDFPRHFSGRRGLGVVTGVAGLTDIDQDCAEARALARFLLPQTPRRHGRKSAPDSHWFYTCDPLPKSMKFVDPDLLKANPDNATIIEIRAAGRQTVVPPSIHPSGEPLVYSERGRPAPVGHQLLSDRAAMIAALTLVARTWPQKGRRHDASLALGGVLARLGFAETEAAAIVSLVAELAGDEEWRDRGQEGIDSVRRHQQNKATIGLPGLLDALQASDARKAKIGVFLVKKRRQRSDQPATEGRGHLSLVRPQEEQNDSRPTHADFLLRLAEPFDYFHTPEGALYVVVPVGAHWRTLALGDRSGDFKRYLTHEFYKTTGGTPSNAAIQSVLVELEGRAQFEGACRSVYTRVAPGEGCFYLDLSDTGYHVVRISADGWEVLQRAPVHFRHPRGQRGLPIPCRGGSLDELQQLIHVRPADWMLVAAWLVFALSPDGPYPILTIHGERGSAKSTTTRLLRAVLDPNEAMTKHTPKEVRDLAVAAQNAWIQAFDNVSHLSPDLSDALCRVSTGAGFSTRALYTDAEEAVFYARRPVILNAIEEVATRGDLLDRCLVVTLPTIAVGQRRSERAIERTFDAAHPRILGALLDVASEAVRNLDTITLSSQPRMADFARWVCAAAPALGWEASEFLSAYEDNRRESIDIELDAVPITGPLLEVVRANDGYWRGTHAGLLQELRSVAGEETQNRRSWPKDETRLSMTLRRIAPALRAQGIRVEHDIREGKSRARYVEIEQREVGDGGR
jgi:hypothetical protein